MEFRPSSTEGFILCCQCGTQIESNPANMCVACLRTQVDITEGIPKTGTLYFCRNCERYLQPPSQWIPAKLESRELLSICLKKLKGLPKVRLVDAGFVWTEPHSKRVKVKVSIQKEVLNGAVLQQVFIVEFTVQNQMCDECHRVEAKDYWRACVQVRQKTNHKKTLFYLEQLILKHGMHAKTTNIKAANDGIDFFYGQKQDSRKLVEFLQNTVPCKHKSAEELISHDIQNNIFNYKHTYCVDVVPVCKDDIVCLSKGQAQQLGNIGQVCIVLRITQTIHLIDPSTLILAELSGQTFWREPFSSICHPKHLVEFTVMDVEIIRDKDRRHIAGQGHLSNKHVLADLWVVRSSELGTNDNQYHCRTHLGHLLNPGDNVLGFNLANSNQTNANLDKMKSEHIPDVVIVRKVFANKTVRNRKRKWKLRHLDILERHETESNDRDYTDFLEDLEEDNVIRQNINIYKDADKIAVDEDDSDLDDFPRISLQEMLDDLHISTDATGDEGGAMLQ